MQQKLMSVSVTMVDVSTTVLTVLVAMSVNVMMDMSYIMIHSALVTDRVKHMCRHNQVLVFHFEHVQSMSTSMALIQ